MTIQQIIEEELLLLRADIIAASEARGQRASGETYAQIVVEDVSETGGKLAGPEYVGVLARGRKPGRVPRDFARIIKEWAGYKGISFGSEAEFNRWANAVAWKIRREGTALWRDAGQFGESDDVFNAPIEAFTNRLRDRIGSFYMTEISNAIDIWQ